MSEKGIHFPNRNRILLMVAFALILVAVVVGSRSLIPRRPSAASMEPFQAVGQVMGEEVAKLMGSSGKVLLLTSSTGGRAFELMEKGLTGSLQSAGITVSAVAAISTDADSQSLWPQFDVVPSEHALKLIRENSESQVLISLVGTPSVTVSEVGRSRLVVLAQGGGNAILRDLMKGGVVVLAVVPRPNSSLAKVPESNLPRKQFDRLFELKTASEADSLPD
jgi:hypothetical protein